METQTQEFMVTPSVYLETRRLLTKVVNGLTYKKGWTFLVQSTTFGIKIECEDSTGKYLYDPNYEATYDPWSDTRFIINSFLNQPFYVVHGFPMPLYVQNELEAERWVLDRIIDVETHEAMEFFKIDNKQVYFPDHEPGGNPYSIQRRSD